MDEQDEFVPRDATTIEPGEVRTGDYFVYNDIRHLVIGVDATLFWYSFVGMTEGPGAKYAQMIVSPPGNIQRFRTITL